MTKNQLAAVRSPWNVSPHDRARPRRARLDLATLPQISDEVAAFMARHGENLWGEIEERANADLAAIYAELARLRAVIADDPLAEAQQRGDDGEAEEEAWNDDE